MLNEIQEQKIYFISGFVLLVVCCFAAGVLLYLFLNDLANEGIQHRKEMDRLQSIRLYDNIELFQEKIV